jgi:hypothetical protein
MPSFEGACVGPQGAQAAGAQLTGSQQRRARSRRQAEAESNDNMKTIANTIATRVHFRIDCIDFSEQVIGEWGNRSSNQQTSITLKLA